MLWKESQAQPQPPPRERRLLRMAPAASKPDEQAIESAEEARRQKLVLKICTSSFFSVCQHFIFAQSEPRLFLNLCDKDAVAAAQLLGNTSGIVGILSLMVNQAGGKLSDSIGRKPGFLLGPLSNILLGWLVFKNPRNRALVTVCRILRLILTTFSNTIMCQAALADICKGNEFSLAQSQIQVATGIAMLLTPFVEGRILEISPWSPDGIRYVYGAMAAIATAHVAFVATQLEETLAVAKRSTAKFTLSMINPFGFLRIFSEGTHALKKLVTITTLQMFLEGKNMSDVIQAFIRDKLQWSVTQVRNFVTSYGLLCLGTGFTATPRLLKALSARDFTTVTNMLNFLGFSVRGMVPSTPLFLGAMVPMLPGVNGASATALKTVQNQIATSQGFGKGEFSAWVNNLRALAGSAAPVLYGQVYAAAEKYGRNPGHVFALAGVLGALIPQLILQGMPDSQLEG